MTKGRIVSTEQLYLYRDRYLAGLLSPTGVHDLTWGQLPPLRMLWEICKNWRCLVLLLRSFLIQVCASGLRKDKEKRVGKRHRPSLIHLPVPFA
jgi:hypothetical protein